MAKFSFRISKKLSFLSIFRRKEKWIEVFLSSLDKTIRVREEIPYSAETTK